MGLAVGTAKYLLFLFNFIFFVTGVAIIAIGGVSLKELGPLDEQINYGITSPSILLVVVGVFVTIISFFGCCGAIRHSYCMLVTFSILLALVFILELAAGIAAYVKRDNLLNNLENAFTESLENSVRNNDTKWWNELQSKEHCCGVHNSTDYEKMFNSTYKIPDTCYNSTETPRAVYDEGCFNWLKNFIEKNIVLIGGIGVGIAFVQILGIVYACCLASAVKEMS
uniref:Tetraspanin n=1 Tax=Hemiscolopendra marginata TaxID=943146 RepID=A0A646QHF6_9MYRI